MADQPMLSIGADLSEAAGPLADAIVKILAVPVEQRTLRAALRAFSRSVSISHVAVTNCHFENAADAAVAMKLDEA